MPGANEISYHLNYCNAGKETLPEPSVQLSRALSNKAKFSMFSQIYAFTTENLAGYMPCLPIKGKNVLTVSGSGDQIINAYLMGAKSITSFDANILSGFFAELKLAALDSFSFDAFKKFFLREDNGCLNLQALNISVYEKLRPKLSVMSVGFFDAAYGYYGGKGVLVRNSPLFNIQFDTNELKLKSNPYLLSEGAYEAARLNARGKITAWINCSADVLTAFLVGKAFNVMMLSNIADYAAANDKGNTEPLNHFAASVLCPLKAHITPCGILCAAYVYDAEKANYRAQVDSHLMRKEAFQKLRMKYSELLFESVISGKKDAAILLQNGGKNEKNRPS